MNTNSNVLHLSVGESLSASFALASHAMTETIRCLEVACQRYTADYAPESTKHIPTARP